MIRQASETKNEQLLSSVAMQAQLKWVLNHSILYVDPELDQSEINIFFTCNHGWSVE